MQFLSIIMTICLYTCPQNVFAVEETSLDLEKVASPIVISVPYELNFHENAEETITFYTEEAIESYLVKVSHTEVWDKLKLLSNQEMGDFMKKNSMLFLECQSKFALVQENSYTFWDHLLAKLPNQSFTMQMFRQEMITIGKDVFEEAWEKFEKNESMKFMIQIEIQEMCTEFYKLLGGRSK